MHRMSPPVPRAHTRTRTGTWTRRRRSTGERGGVGAAAGDGEGARSVEWRRTVESTRAWGRVGGRRCGRTMSGVVNEMAALKAHHSVQGDTWRSTLVADHAKSHTLIANPVQDRRRLTTPHPRSPAPPCPSWTPAPSNHQPLPVRRKPPSSPCVAVWNL